MCGRLIGDGRVDCAEIFPRWSGLLPSSRADGLKVEIRGKRGSAEYRRISPISESVSNNRFGFNLREREHPSWIFRIFSNLLLLVQVPLLVPLCGNMSTLSILKTPQASASLFRFRLVFNDRTESTSSSSVSHGTALTMPRGLPAVPLSRVQNVALSLSLSFSL